MENSAPELPGAPLPRRSRPFLYRPGAVRFLGMLTALLAGVSVGCEAETGPVVPVLPPLAIAAPDAEGLVRINGDSEPAAQVFGFNEDTGRGVIETAGDDGRYLLVIAGETGDTILVWQRVGVASSAARAETVP